MPKVRDSNVNGGKEPPLSWTDIEWKAAKKRVRNLRQRIYRATKEGNWRKVKSLQKLMLRSYSNLLTSTRKITQENQGRRTPGVDGEKALTPESRVKILQELQEYKTWKVKPTKRLYIPKANGKKRPLGIPVVRDRIVQNMVKNALEPKWEAQFEANSHGFRPGRSTQDAIKQCWLRLNATCGDESILDADIKGAFDNISHEYILKTIGHVPGKELIKQWLKAGYLEEGQFFATEKGTPQGGVISPLLSNIALHGLGRVIN